MLAMLRGDTEAAAPYIADDIRWLMAPSIAASHPPIKSKKEWMSRNSGIKQLFPEGLTTDIKHMFCDGDAVIVEFTNKGKVANGKYYSNEYCTVFVVEGGQIKEIREYQDSLHVHHTFLS